jgi:hypothetical protein
MLNWFDAMLKCLEAKGPGIETRAQNDHLLDSFLQTRLQIVVNVPLTRCQKLPDARAPFFGISQFGEEPDEGCQEGVTELPRQWIVADATIGQNHLLWRESRARRGSLLL